MKTFKGLSLTPADAFRNIASLIEAGLLIAVTDIASNSDLADCVFQLTKQYSEAAHDAALENQK
ncbi:hypothetical protein ACVQMG_000525 [Enterobacter roggenkampii]